LRYLIAFFFYSNYFSAELYAGSSPLQKACKRAPQAYLYCLKTFFVVGLRKSLAFVCIINLHKPYCCLVLLIVQGDLKSYIVPPVLDMWKAKHQRGLGDFSTWGYIIRVKAFIANYYISLPKSTRSDRFAQRITRLSVSSFPSTHHIPY